MRGRVHDPFQGVLGFLDEPGLVFLQFILFDEVGDKLFLQSGQSAFFGCVQ